MRSGQDWLDAGLNLLGEEGLAGLRIEALCSAVGATRGSFYHHFVDMAGFRRALLEEFEQRWTTRLIEAAEARAPDGPEAQLWVLKEQVLESQSYLEAILERNFRAWATQGDDAAAMMARVDSRRLSYLVGLVQQLGYDEPEAESRARHLALVVIGASLISPPSTADQLRAILHPLFENLLMDADR